MMSIDKIQNNRDRMLLFTICVKVLHSKKISILKKSTIPSSFSFQVSLDIDGIK